MGIEPNAGSVRVSNVRPFSDIDSRIAHPDLVPEATIARTLGVTTRTLQRMRKQGCPFRKFGSAVFYNYADVVEWMETRK